MKLPQKLYQMANLYTISGAAMGVYAITCVGGRFGAAVDLLALILSLLTAVSLYLVRPEKVPWWNPVHLLLIGINASLIFIHATGFNTATHAFPTQQVPKVARQSLFPVFDAVPWFPPADQRIAAQFVTRTVNEVVATTQQVRAGLDDLAAPIREERAGLEKRLREERSRLEKNLYEGRLSLERDLREKRSGLEKNLKARVVERQRLEETLRIGVHPAERKAVESRLAEVQQAENRLHDEIAEHEKRAQEMLEKLDAKEKQSLAELDSQEKLWKDRLEEMVIKERHLKELEKEAAPILETLKQQLDKSQKRLNESVQKLDSSYAGVRGYSSDLLPKK